MPFYEYRCAKGHTFEVMQSMSDDPVTTCTTCSAAVQRVFHPVAIHFKGSGFYNTDYGRKKGRGDRGADGSSDGAGEGKKSESKGDPKGESKKASTSTASDTASKAE